MKITNFNQTPQKRIREINSYLKEAHGVQVKGLHSKGKLESIKEKAEQTLVRLRNTNRKFNLDPEYAKFLGVRDVIDVMINEGVYAESPAMQEMKSGIVSEVKALMDGGYTMDEASKECMNKFRKDSRYAHDDEFVLPIVLKAAKDYMEACSSMSEEVAEAFPETDINEYLFQEMAKEVGMEIDNVDALKAIEEKISMFAEVSGKSRDSVVGFLNGLEEDAVANGIQMFGKKVAEQNKFTGARKDAIAQGKKSFEVDGTEFDITGDTKDEKKQAKESMFDDIIDEMINEEVEVEQAEVVMALRALADDVQEHVERVGRMINEDLPAILDQMKSEFGAEQAVQMKQTMEQTLTAVLDSNKAGKDGLDGVIAGLTGSGDGSMLGAEPGMEPGLGGEEEPALGGEEEPAMDNVPAAAGPEEEPLGRAPVEL
jgi:hypothetical protein